MIYLLCKLRLTITVQSAQGKIVLSSLLYSWDEWLQVERHLVKAQLTKTTNTLPGLDVGAPTYLGTYLLFYRCVDTLLGLYVDTLHTYYSIVVLIHSQGYMQVPLPIYLHTHLKSTIVDAYTNGSPFFSGLNLRQYFVKDYPINTRNQSA